MLQSLERSIKCTAKSGISNLEENLQYVGSHIQRKDHFFVHLENVPSFPIVAIKIFAGQFSDSMAFTQAWHDFRVRGRQPKIGHVSCYLRENLRRKLSKEAAKQTKRFILESKLQVIQGMTCQPFSLERLDPKDRENQVLALKLPMVVIANKILLYCKETIQSC